MYMKSIVRSFSSGYIESEEWKKEAVREKYIEFIQSSW